MKKIIIFLLIFCLGASFATSKETANSDNITPKDFSYLFKSLNGLSENQLSQHNTLYLRYVNKLNEINEKLKTADKEKANAAHSEYRDLKIDRVFSNNGVILHELYFENLSPISAKPSRCFEVAIVRDFSSYDNYIADLKSSMKSTRNGWVISAYNFRTGKIENYIFEFHDLYLPVDIKPLLVIDVWEHAYMIDYGIDKDSYIKAFFNNVDWNIVSNRYKTIK